MQQHIWLRQSAPGEVKTVSPVEWQIVGVNHDVLSKDMRDHSPEIQIPFWQSTAAGPVIAVRTAEDPGLMTKSISAAVHSVSPAATVARPRTMEQIRNQVLSSDRFSMILFLSFGAVALLLAILGVYGVMSFSVAERTREIALRMALGADRTHLIAWFVKTECFIGVRRARLRLRRSLLCLPRNAKHIVWRGNDRFYRTWERFLSCSSS